jgi:hypothetical protein
VKAEMGEAFGTCWEKINVYRILFGRIKKEIGNLGDLGVDGLVIL